MVLQNKHKQLASKRWNKCVGFLQSRPVRRRHASLWLVPSAEAGQTDGRVASLFTSQSARQSN